MPRRLSAFGLAVALASLALSACGGRDDAAPARRASIEPGVGIAGVRLQDPSSRVRAVLGPPDDVRPSDLHGGWRLWAYRERRLRVTLTERGQVWDLRTLAGSDRTAEGVGVGSTEAEVRRAFPTMACGPRGGPDRYRDWRVCSDRHAPDAPFTSFTLVRGRVSIATVARGLAV